MRRRVECLVAVVVVTLATDGVSAAPGQKADDEARPSMDLLEFLGLLIEQDDGYIDPLDLFDMEAEEQSMGTGGTPAEEAQHAEVD